MNNEEYDPFYPGYNAEIPENYNPNENEAAYVPANAEQIERAARRRALLEEMAIRGRQYGPLTLEDSRLEQQRLDRQERISRICAYISNDINQRRNQIVEDQIQNDPVQEINDWLQRIPLVEQNPLVPELENIVQDRVQIFQEVDNFLAVHGRLDENVAVDVFDNIFRFNGI